MAAMLAHLPTRRRCYTAIASVLVACLLIPGCGKGKTTSSQTGGAAAETGMRVGEGEDGEALTLRGRNGETIRGRSISADPSVVLRGCSDITIIGCDLRGVEVSGSRGVRIVNCYIHDSAGNAVYLDDCDDVLVQGNRVECVRTGVLAHRSRGVRVIGNYVQDVRGPMPGGQLVQFDKVTGAGNVIMRNYGVNHRGRSSPEDMVSVYQSHGTEDSPILIEANYLAGDPEHGSAGKSGSGSGIMLGDGGGSWQVARANTLISPGQVGIGVAGGEDITVEYNVILGERSDVSNVGLYVWNQDERPGGRVVVRENIVAWVNSEGRDNPYWDGGGFAGIDQIRNTLGGRSLMDGITTPGPPTPAPQPPVPFVEPGQ